MAPNPPTELRAALVAEAIRCLGTREEPKGSNRGTDIDYWLKLVGSPLGSPWCAAFIWAMGLQATGRALWPVKMTGRVQAIVDHHTALGHVHQDAPRAVPGDLVVFYYPSLKRYGHIAVLEHAIANGRVRTLDGNSAPDATAGSAADREGYAVCRKNRPLNDRVAFIAWAT